MKGPFWKAFTSTVLLSLPLMACVSATPDPVDVEMKVKVRVAATLTQEALDRESQQDQQAEAQPAATGTPLPPSQTPQPSPTVQPTPSYTPTVAHITIPGDPLDKINSHLTDVSSLGFAPQGYTYGDQYLINRFERPFTAQEMVYKGYLDITLTNLKYNPPWVYFVIILQEDLPEAGGPVYGVELDLDEDGRGEYFIAAALPQGMDWTTQGVVVYRDIDGDVGGPNPTFSDAPTSGLTGYEEIVFNQGRGEDPDLAWVRRDPDAPNQIQIAIKDALVGSAGYLWSIWADEGPRDQTLADYNDVWTFEEAGSPFPDHPFYPLKELALVDSTCRSWYGFEPTGSEPGLCQMAGGETGWRVCVTYVFGASEVKSCSNVCQEQCPDLPPNTGGQRWSCEKCKMP